MFLECPRKYHAKYIGRALPFEESPALVRGGKIHGLMEEEVRGNAPGWPESELPVREWACGVLRALRLKELKGRGWEVTPELECAASRTGGPSDWNGKDAFVRSRIDLCMASPDRGRVTVIDWKTGKTDGDALQLQMNVLSLARLRRPGQIYTLMFINLDKRRIETAEYGPPDVAFPVEPTPEAKAMAARSPFRKAWEGLIACIEAHRSGEFPRNEGPGCRWCGIAGSCV
jgi:hypothetical protein